MGQIMLAGWYLGRSPVELVERIEKGEANSEDLPSLLRGAAGESDPVITSKRDSPLDCPPRASLLVADPNEDEELAVHITHCQQCKQFLRLFENLRRLDLSPREILAGELPLTYQVFVDESGSITPTYENEKIPSLALAAVITVRDKVRCIEEVRRSLVLTAGLPEDTEIHTSACLYGEGAFQGLSPQRREQILWDFVEQNEGNYLFHYSPDMLKSFVKEETQVSLRERGLSQYAAVFQRLIFTIGKYVELILHGDFELYFDRNDAVLNDLQEVATNLSEQANNRLRLRSLRGDLVAMESHESAAIQLCDVIAHYVARHHRIEIPKFEHGPALHQHGEKIIHFYEVLLAPKTLPWMVPEICTNVDWKAFGEIEI